MELLLTTIIAHFLSDFVFQSEKIVRLKKEKKIRGYLYHFLVVFIITFCLSTLILANFKDNFQFTLTISILHIIFDLFKELLTNKSAIIDFYAFIVDQSVHLLTIYISWNYYINNFTIPVNTWPDSLDFYNLSTSIGEILITIIVYLIILFFGAIFLEKLLKVVDFKLEKSKEIKLSRYIGIIERALILTLVTFGYVSSIGIIFTAKSLARYKEFNKDKYVEYYLLGTLASLFIALIGGLFLGNIIL